MLPIPKPRKLSDRIYAEMLYAGRGISMIVADFDFETYSPAGYVWNAQVGKFEAPHGAANKGLETVGLTQYAEHPETEVLCMAYNLKDGRGVQMWKPGLPNPTALFEHLEVGWQLEAWNVGFEYWIWTNVCVPKYGWPELPIPQLRCAMAKAQAFGLPGALGKAATVLGLKNQKDKRGEALLKLFSVPHNRSKNDSSLRTSPREAPEEFQTLCDYCEQDIATEAEASSVVPDLNDFELKFWQCDQAINLRGVAIDLAAIENAIAIMDEAYEKLNLEVQVLTGWEVNSINELAKIASWANRIMDPDAPKTEWAVFTKEKHAELAERGLDLSLHFPSEQALINPKAIHRTDIIYEKQLLITTLDSAAIIKLLGRSDLPFSIRRVLEIRQILGSAAVKKLYAMKNQVGRDGRLHNLFRYHGARTGRAAGHGPQPQNLPNSGPFNKRGEEWDHLQVDRTIELMAQRDFQALQYEFDDPLAAMAGCLRGMFIAAPGKTLVCSDYSAIEAVVLAALAGEEWRMDVFRTHGMIYEMSASKITGIPFEEYVRHKKETGQHHPTRKSIGKIAELASGYAGWIGAWKQFGADKFFTEDQIIKAIKAWRAASPAIVEFWGGQRKGWNKQLFGVEGTVIQAIFEPGVEIEYRGLKFLVKNKLLTVQLLSGRYLTYHDPHIELSTRSAYAIKQGELSITFMGWNSNPKKGGMGWIRINTYGGQLVENIVQATARDILAHAIVKLERIKMPVVLHVHDEIVCEVFETDQYALGALEEVMSTMPAWAKGWPLKATGGWVGKRYRK